MRKITSILMGLALALTMTVGAYAQDCCNGGSCCKEGCCKTHKK
jgi:hypothetical protein